MAKNTKDLPPIEELQRLGLGMLELWDAYDGLKDTLTLEQTKNLQSVKELHRAYLGTYGGNAAKQTAPKIKLFNAIAQCYKDVGNEGKAEETLQKRDQWVEKYSFDQ